MTALEDLKSIGMHNRNARSGCEKTVPVHSRQCPANELLLLAIGYKPLGLF